MTQYISLTKINAIFIATTLLSTTAEGAWAMRSSKIRTNDDSGVQTNGINQKKHSQNNTTIDGRNSENNNDSKKKYVKKEGNSVNIGIGAMGILPSGFLGGGCLNIHYKGGDEYTYEKGSTGSKHISSESTTSDEPPSPPPFNPQPYNKRRDETSSSLSLQEPGHRLGGTSKTSRLLWENNSTQKESKTFAFSEAKDKEDYDRDLQLALLLSMSTIEPKNDKAETDEALALQYALLEQREISNNKPKRK